MADPITQALEEASATTGRRFQLKPKFLRKFGRIANLGTAEQTIQEHGGTETYKTDNSINTILSDDAGDDQTVKVEGHTVSGGEFSFVVQSATLNGTSGVTLTTPLARATRIYNTGTTDFAGVVDVTDGATVYLEAGSYNGSQKAATTISKDDCWLITTLYGSVLKKTTASVDFSIQVRSAGSVFRELLPFNASTSYNPGPIILNEPLIVYPNSDFQITGISSATNTDCEAWAGGYLAKAV